uniref:B30.2/SPRY domain-containing protein n=1 Tax=Sphenodon punctatus TaxID=8508 RepID=A0A8D0G8C7_SPHPU
GQLFLLWLSLLLPNGGDGEATKVTFDPDTAYPWLIVSADGKYVISGNESQSVPDNSKRFSRSPCVLGSRGFTSGKHYWEVEFGNQREWAVGVARESVERKEYLRLSPEEGIWAEGRWWLRRRDLSSQGAGWPVGKIIVYLDYKAGLVVFYVEGKVIPMSASFNGERVFPFFYVGGGVWLKLNF